MVDAKTYYNQHSQEYAEKWQHMEHDLHNASFAFRRRLIETIVQMAHITSGERVVEIGAGTGLVLRELLKYTRPVYGTDISGEMLQRIKDTVLRNVPDGDVILKANDFLHLDLQEHFFDKIISLEVLRYIEDLDTCFRHVARIMKRDSMFVFSVTNLFSTNLFPMKFWLRKKLGLVHKDKEIMQYFVTEHTLRKKLANAGFVVVDFRRMRLTPIKYRLERFDAFLSRLPFIRNLFDTYLVAVRLK